MAGEKCPQFQELSPRVAELSKLFIGRAETLKIAPQGYTCLKPMRKHIYHFSQFEFEDTDVLVHTYPKSGTTWTQEIVWTMRNNPNLDNPQADTPLSTRTPYFESDSVDEDFIGTHPQFVEKFNAKFPEYDKSCGVFLYLIKQSPRPRTIKCHLPLSLLAPSFLDKAKVVSVLRDPRDVCISFHHHTRLFTLEKFRGTFDQFIDAFIEDAVQFAPYWAHVNEVWSRRDHPNMHIIFYESLKNDPMKEVARLNDFLGTKLTDEQIGKVVKHASFEEMKKRGDHCVASDDAPDFLDMEVVKNEGGFFRKGQAGGWRKVMTRQQKDKFQVWIEKNCPDKEIMNRIMNC